MRTADFQTAGLAIRSQAVGRESLPSYTSPYASSRQFVDRLIILEKEKKRESCEDLAKAAAQWNRNTDTQMNRQLRDLPARQLDSSTAKDAGSKMQEQGRIIGDKDSHGKKHLSQLSAKAA